MKKLTTLIIMDASTSMMQDDKHLEVRDGLKNAVEDYIKDFDEESEETLIITQFSDYSRFEVLVNSNSIEDLNPSAVADSYRVGGMTALRDAIGRSFGLVPENQDGVLVTIYTDGRENASMEFSESALKELISQKKEQGWSVIFQGTTEEAIAAANRMGTRSAKKFDNNAQGFAGRMEATRELTASYRRTVKSGKSISQDDLDID